MPKIDLAAQPVRAGSRYPAGFAARVGGRSRRSLGDAAGLTTIGVHLTRLQPGAMSALRRWRERADEFVYVLEGELTLIEEDGAETLRPGDAAGFKAGVANGHHLVNRSDATAVYLEIGSRLAEERAHYPDDDLAVVKSGGAFRFTRKDGSEFED